METNQLTELVEAISTKQSQKMEALEAKQAEIKTELETKSAELEEANERIQDLESKATVKPAEVNLETKSLGELCVENDGFAKAKEGGRARFEVKAAASTVTNEVAITQSQRLAGIVALPQHTPSIYNYLPKVSAISDNVEYIREKTFTNATNEVAETAAKPLSAVEFEKVTVPIPTAAHLIKVTEQMLADNAAVVSHINAAMPSKLIYKVDELVFKGSGTMKGLTDATNFTAYTGASGDKGFDSVRKAQAAMQVDGFTPSIVIMHPEDVAALDLLKDSQGNFIAANPRTSNAAVVWGLTILTSLHITKGEFIMMDSSYVNIHLRQGATMEVGYDGDDFSKNLRTIRAEMRLGLAVRNKAAVRKGDLNPS